jgi:uncharacterized membrane protein YhhN
MTLETKLQREAASVPGAMATGGAMSLILLWLAWATLLIGAMVVGNLDSHGSAAATAARMGSSIALVLAGWLAYATWRRTAVGLFALLVAVGMTLGTVGDFFNAGLLKFIPLADPTLGGIAAFALGHLAYIAGTLNLATRAGLTNRRAMLVAIVVWQLIALAGWYLVAYQGTDKRDLVWPALPYSLLLAGTAGVASGLALQDRRFAGFALGGALFLVSDLILACGMFGGSIPHQTEWVWLTYGPGQMLIVFSVATAALVLARRIVAAAR